MADAFISYSSADPDGPSLVGAVLEAAGYSVWWDSHLVSGQKFQDEITRQLNEARVVVVLWSKASVGSDWVYSEARRASQQGKLIQLRSHDVTLDDLPAPFDAFHCPFTDDADSLLRAMALALKRDASQPESTSDPATGVAGDVAGGGAAEAPSTLPPTRSRIVGRESDIAELVANLAEGDRLITLTGPGGSGKSRLALEIAHQLASSYADGAVFVALASATSTDAAYAAIAEAAGLNSKVQNREGAFAWAHDFSGLLVLDNLDHLETPDHVVDGLLEAGASVHVLCTSRRSLHVLGERTHPVKPLGLPHGDSLDEVAQSSAVALFVEGAHRASSRFKLTEENAADVATLCRRLDGLPLGLELVSARVKMLSPAAILKRLDTTLDLGTAVRGREARHQTLRAAIQWSYDLLSDPEKQSLGVLSVFEGGASLDALMAVIEVAAPAEHDVFDSIETLVDASLVQAEESTDGEPRFSLLRSLQQFVSEQLADDARAAAETAHAQHFYDLACSFAATSIGDETLEAVGLRLDVANFQAAMSRSVLGLRHPEFYDAADVPPLHVDTLLGRSLYNFFDVNLLLQCREILGAQAHGNDPVGLAAFTELFGWMTFRRTGELEILENAVGLLRSQMAVSDPAVNLPEWVHPYTRLVLGLRDLGWAYYLSGQVDRARAALVELLELDGPLTATRRAKTAELRFLIASGENLDEARTHLTEYVALIAEEGGTDPVAINNLADIDLLQGRFHDAHARLSESCAIILGSNVNILIVCAETMAAAIGEHDPLLCARVYGSSGVRRHREYLPNDPYGDEEDKRVFARVKPLVDESAWDLAFEQGKSEDLADLMREMAALQLPSTP